MVLNMKFATSDALKIIDNIGHGRYLSLRSSKSRVNLLNHLVTVNNNKVYSGSADLSS